MPNIKRYKVKWSTLIAVFVICCLCVAFLVYIFKLDYLINEFSIDGVEEAELNKLILYRTISDCLVVIVSILGTNLLLSVFIERKNKNNMVTEFLVNEMLASESVYSNLSNENQETILKNLELHKNFDNNLVLYEMHNYVNKKLKSDLKDYYFTECEYVVEVVAKESYFEKVITHTIELKPYKSNKTISNFTLGIINFKNIDGVSNYEIKDVLIDGKSIKIEYDSNGMFTNRSDIQAKTVPNKNKLDNKNGYNTTVRYYLKQKLHCKNDKPIKIVSNYVTRCPLDDINTTFRASVPSKKFSVNYTIAPEDKYELHGNAFGFIDASTSFPNNHKPNVIRFGFNNWIFTDDGVSITTIKK